MKIKRTLAILFFLACGIILNGSTLQYLNSVVEQEYVTRADCLKCVAYMLGKKNIEDINGVVKFLKSKNVINKESKVTLSGYANRGYLSQLLVRAIGLNGGLWGTFVKSKYRPCYRQLLQYKIMPSGGWRYKPDGTELVGVVSRANQFRKGVRLW